MYRILLIEDDDREADTLTGHLARYARERDVDLHVRRIGSAMEFVAEEHPADLVFMDIGLPGIDGLEAAGILRGVDETTPLVFVTNLAQHAVRGYQVQALDFLLKPVQYQALCMTMERAMRVLERNARHTIPVAVKEGVRVLDSSDVVYVDVTNHDLTYHLMDGTVLTTRGVLAKLEEELGTGQFVRISKSCLANMGCVRKIRGDELAMAGGTTLYISRSKKKDALAALAEYLGGSR